MVYSSSPTRPIRRLSKLALLLAGACLFTSTGDGLRAQSTPAPKPPAGTGAAPAKADEAAAKRSPEQLESLVAPIALYPDPLLAQTLAASTYPLEMIQLQQWMAKNKNLKDKALSDAVAKQPWDPAVQSMAAFPDAVKRLADDIQWTTDLGNAFLAQQSDVMDAVQRMRKKAKDNKALASNEQQKVETKTVESKEVIIIEPANPQVIYVPTYNPTYVYGPYPYPAYPYPPVYYPPYTPGAAFMTFSFGVMMGAAWGGAWGHCGWGGSNNIYINNNNNFNKVNHYNKANVGGGNNNWSHNANHRGGTPYGDKATANKYGGSNRGGASAGTMDRGGGTGSRGGASASTADRGGGAGSRGGASASTADRGGGAGSRGGASAGTMDRGGGSGNQIGSRDMGSSASRSSSKGGGLGSSSGGFSGSSARQSSSRGASSFGGGSRGGGGGRRR